MSDELTAWPYLWVFVKMSLVILLAKGIVWSLKPYSSSLKAMVWAVAILVQPVVFLTGLQEPLFKLIPSVPDSLKESFTLMRVDQLDLSSSLGGNNDRYTSPAIEGQGRFSGSPYIAELSVFSDDLVKIDADPLLGEASQTAFEVELLAAYDRKKKQELSINGIKFFVILVWASVAALVLVPLIISRFQVKKFRSERVAHDTDVARVWTKIGSSKSQLPHLCLSNNTRVPFACGIKSPTVVLPRESLSWSKRRLKSTLLHELAHTERKDPLIRTLSSLIKALCWFHPLVWYAHRELVHHQEQACDELAMQSGISATDYAEDLLATVDRYDRTPAQALAMAKWSRLGCRIRWVLSDQSKILKPTTLKKNVTSGFLVVLSLCVGVIGFADEIKEIRLSASGESEETGEEDINSEITDEQMISKLTSYLAELDGQIKSAREVDLDSLSDFDEREENHHSNAIERLDSHRIRVSKLAGALEQIETLDHLLAYMGELDDTQKSYLEKVLNSRGHMENKEEAKMTEMNFLKLNELDLRHRLLLSSSLSHESAEISEIKDHKARLLRGEEIQLPPFDQAGAEDANVFLLKAYFEQRNELIVLLDKGVEKHDREVLVRKRGLKKLRSQIMAQGYALYLTNRSR